MPSMAKRPFQVSAEAFVNCQHMANTPIRPLQVQYCRLRMSKMLSSSPAVLVKEPVPLFGEPNARLRRAATTMRLYAYR